jgi:hypothetical protein
MPPIQGAGGTPGGLGTFASGVALSGLGLYLLFSRVMVSAGMWHGYFGSHYGPGTSIGATVVPFVGGVGVLFVNARAKSGWALVALSLALLTLEILTSLQIHLLPTPLPALLGMLAMMGGGLGLIVRSFRASAPQP